MPQDDDMIRAYGGDPDFLRRLERGEHLTDNFLKNVGPGRSDVDPETLKGWQEVANKAAADLRTILDNKGDSDFKLEACMAASMTPEEEVEYLKEADEWLASQAESVLFAKAPLKMYCIFLPDALKVMKGIRGKLAAQAGHAFLHAWWDALLRHEDLAKAYLNSEHAYKITLKAPDDATEDWFDDMILAYRSITGVTKVVDAGFTVFDGPTLTCIGIGPVSPDDCDDILKGLKLLS